MIKHSEFATLRLAEFATEDAIRPLEHWEYDDGVWVGMAVGFTEFLFAPSTPERLDIVTVDMVAFCAADRLMARLELPVRLGQSPNDVIALLGSPVSRHDWTAQRYDLHFSILDPSPYAIECTFVDGVGLSYVVLIAQHT